MKKIIAVLIVLSVFLTTPSFAMKFNDIHDCDFEKEIMDMVALGIITGYEDGTYKPENLLTRAEFCQLIIRLNALDENLLTSDKQYYYDVSTNHWAFNAISYMTALGWITGGVDGNFNPDNKISYAEALKIIINFLGYKYKADLNGGYPSGYLIVANELGISKGISGITHSTYINRAEAAKILHNAIEIPLVIKTGISENETYEIDSSKNILSEYLKCGKYTGVVSANEYYGISDTLASEGCLLVDGFNFKCSEDDKHKVGEKLTFFFRIDEVKDTYTIIRISESESEELILSCDNKPYYNKLNISYEKDNRDEKAKISPYIQLIYNGELTDFTDDAVNNLSNGTIKLLSTDGDKVYDIIFVNSYSTMVVGQIRKDTGEVKSIDYKTIVDFSKIENYSIKNSSGENLSYDQIGENSVFSWYKNNNYLEGYVSNEIISGKISEAKVDNNTLFYTIYDREVAMLSGVGTTGRLGDAVKVYIDYFGKGVFVEDADLKGKDYWYMVSVRDTGIPEITHAVKGKFYNMDKGLTGLVFAKDVIVNGSKIKDITTQSLTTAIGNISPQVLAMELNENGEIISIETPTPYRELMENTGSDGFCEVFGFAEREFFTDGTSFDNKIKLDRSTSRVMVVPENPEDASDKAYQTITYKDLKNGEGYDVAAYHSNKDYVNPDLIVIRTKDNISSQLTYSDPIAIIAKKVHTINEDEEQVIKYTAYSQNTEIELYVNPNDTPVLDGELSSADLQAGDVIHYISDNFGYIKTFQRYYNRVSGFTQRGTYTDFIDRPITIVESEIKLYNDLYITVPDAESSNPYEYYMLTPHSSMNLVIVEGNGANAIITPGTIKDLNVGDRIILHVCYNYIRSIIIIR